MCGIHIVTSFYKIYYEKVKIIIIIIIIIKNHFTTGKADKHYLSRIIRSVPRLISHMIVSILYIIKMAVYRCIYSTKTDQS